MNEQVEQYLHLDSYVFWTKVHWGKTERSKRKRMINNEKIILLMIMARKIFTMLLAQAMPTKG